MLNSTEDETFRKLQQSPFIEVYNEIRHPTDPLYLHNVMEILDKHHWTYKEYKIAINKFYDSM